MFLVLEVSYLNGGLTEETPYTGQMVDGGTRIFHAAAIN